MIALWDNCRNCRPGNRKCTPASIVTALREPLLLDDIMVIKDESGKSANDLRKLGFMVFERHDGIYRTFNDQEKAQLGIMTMDVPRPESVQRLPEPRRLYGAPKKCPIRIEFGAKAPA